MLNHRQDLGGSSIGPDITEDQIDAGAAQLFASLVSLRSVVDEPGAHERGPLADPLFDLALISLQPLFEAAKLGPVGRETNPEYSDFGFFVLWQVNPFQAFQGPADKAIICTCTTSAPKLFLAEYRMNVLSTAR